MVESTSVTQDNNSAAGDLPQSEMQAVEQPMPVTIAPYMNKLMVNPELRREYFAIAPMVDVSDKYFRYFMRLLTKHAFLYTEMVNENAVLHACQGRDRLLSFSENQHPVVCQLGGNDPVTMGQAAKVCQEFGYDEVNVNCGCPSNKV